MQERDHFDKEYCRYIRSIGDASSFKSILFCYDGKSPEPQWTDDKESMYCAINKNELVNTDSFVWVLEPVRQVCTIEADLSPLCSLNFVQKNKETGVAYWKLSFRIELSFGLTELQARFEWEDNVSTIYIIYIYKYLAKDHPTGRDKVVSDSVALRYASLSPLLTVDLQPYSTMIINI